MLVVIQYRLVGNTCTFQYLHNIVQEGKTALMLAKERLYPNLELVHLLEEVVSSEEVNTFCRIVCNYTLRQAIPDLEQNKLKLVSS